jgi:predicted nucleic acid-binding protein
LATLYFDSSAYVKLVVDEPHRATAVAMWDDATRVVTSRLAYPEVRAAIAAATRDGRLDERGAKVARRRVGQLWSATFVLELTDDVARAAGDVSDALGLRGADAVHLASALSIAVGEFVFVAWDLRLRSAAVDSGLAIAPPV